jgi:hypothetical protein
MSRKTTKKVTHLDIYDPLIHTKGFSVFSGGETIETDDRFDSEFFQKGILKAFINDIDIREITVTSTCIGFSRTFTKQNKKETELKQ